MELDDEHPLVLELKSLRSAVDRFQHEAHASSVKLQRHSLDTSHTLERANILERENTRLKEEIALLRAHPDISPHPATLQLQELTLGLRRVSDKLDLTEEVLFTRTTELAHALSDLAKSKYQVEYAFELASRIRGKEQEGKARERELERRARAADEERKMTDLVVQEYADLVRSLEGRPSAAGPNYENLKATCNTSNAALVNGLSESKSGLQKLLEEFNGEMERLEAEVVQLHGELAASETRRAAERQGAEHDRVQLAKALTELEKFKIDDKAAAKIVSRYMKFSQSSTDSLQRAMDNLKARHLATNATLILQADSLQKTLASDRRQAEKLRQALDDLSEDMARETYGRRREVSLRLALVSREEVIAESLRRWSRRARELFERAASSDAQEEVHFTFKKAIEEAEAVLLILDGKSSSYDDPPGSVARIFVAQDAVTTLVHELEIETAKRIDLERTVGHEEEIEAPQTPLLPRLPPSLPPKEADTSKPFKIRIAKGPIESAPASPLPLPCPPPRSQEPQVEKDTDSFSVHSVEEDATLSDTETSVAPPSTESPGGTTPSSVSVSMHESNQSSPAPSDEQELSDEISPPPPPVSPSRPEVLGLPSDQTLVEAASPSPAPSEITSEDPPLPVPFPTSHESPVQEIRTLSAHTSPEQPSEDLADDTSLQNQLLAELTQVHHRYDDLQRSFRDCHLALKQLKKTVSNTSYPPDTANILQIAVERLNDFSEDARVELEIRVADEELAIRGFETLLSVPGALPDNTERDEILNEIRHFVDGTEASVTRYTQQFTRKLDDLEHDIAAVKRALHELPVPERPPHSAASSPGWTQWTAGLLGAGTPRTPDLAPTFGSVMTSPRLRYSSLTSRAPTPDPTLHGDPFATLGLRVPMPSHIIAPQAALGIGTRPVPRTRTTSAMYMLGLGSRSPSLTLPRTPPRTIFLERTRRDDDAGTDADTDAGNETDVE